jgi:hypothetical protein
MKRGRYFILYTVIGYPRTRKYITVFGLTIQIDRERVSAYHGPGISPITGLDRL